MKFYGLKVNPKYKDMIRYVDEEPLDQSQGDLVSTKDYTMLHYFDIYVEEKVKGKPWEKWFDFMRHPQHFNIPIFNELYFLGRKSAYVDIYGKAVDIYFSKSVNNIYIDNVHDGTKFYIYADTPLRIQYYTKNVHKCEFYCKKEAITLFSMMNPNIRFKELIP